MVITVNSCLADTPLYTNTLLLRTGAKSSAKTAKKCRRITDTLFGPKRTFVLFYSRYNGHLGRIEWHILLFVSGSILKIGSFHKLRPCFPLWPHYLFKNEETILLKRNIEQLIIQNL